MSPDIDGRSSEDLFDDTFNESEPSTSVQDTEVPQKSRSLWFRLLAIPVVTAIIGGIIGGSIVWAVAPGYQRSSTNRWSGVSGPGLSAAAEGISAEGPNSRDISLGWRQDSEENTVAVAAAAIPGVVQIRVRKSQPHSGFTVPVQGGGSGFVYDQQGYIVTNNHVVAGGERVEVVFSDGRIFAATVVGTDRLTDLAVVKVDRPAGELAVLPLGDSDRVRVGQKAIAIGSPLGDDNGITMGLNKAPSVTQGIISAKDRSMPVMSEKDENVTDFRIENLLQTDAAINPGNSGGPLLNSRGEVVGVNTAIIPGAQGIGFAIPSNVVRSVVPDLIKGGKVNRAYLGITFNDLSKVLADLGDTFKPPVARGVLVMEVRPGTPAAKAGLKGFEGSGLGIDGDIIVAINGIPVDGDTLPREILKYKPGETVKLDVYRGDKRIEISISLGQRD